MVTTFADSKKQHPIDRGWRKRLFAWMIEKGGPCNNKEFVKCRQSLLSNVSGTVLEIGPGTGDNFAYLSSGITWIGIEPNPYMHPYLIDKAGKYGINPDLRRGYAERLATESSSVDAVVCTHVLCSVAQPSTVMSEIIRVLKPGGKFLFVEHVAGRKGTFLRFVQRLIRLVWGIFADGCHLDRETWDMIENAGFESVTYGLFRMSPRAICPVNPHIYGTAIKKP